MITKSQVFQFIGSTFFNEFVAGIVDDRLEALKDAIKKADQDQKSQDQNLQTQLYQVLIDVLDRFPYNQYGKDSLYDAAERILSELLNRKDCQTAVASGLQVLGQNATAADYSDFQQHFCDEICKEENHILYKTINMLWRMQESEHHHRTFDKLLQYDEKTQEMLGTILEQTGSKEAHHTADPDVFPVENRVQKYAGRWDDFVFLNHFDEEDESDGDAADRVNIRLRELYREDLLPQYKKSDEKRSRDTLKKILTDAVVTIDKKRMLLILGQAGIGKSTLITWILANLPVKDQVLVYQFTPDLENVDWQKDNLLSEIVKALKLTYQEIKNKALILDGFDEIYIPGDRVRVLNKLEQELKRRNALKQFSLIVTCRENCIYDLQSINCDHITLQPWNKKQIETFCHIYWEKCGQAAEETKIRIIQQSKEIFGIPLILYMILALHVSIDKSSCVADIYDQIFSLKRGVIYERCYDTEHRINEPAIKKYIHQTTQNISFWIFEHNAERAVIRQKNFREIGKKVWQETTYDSNASLSDTLIGCYFMINHCEGKMADEVSFVHRSIYEYFVAVYFFEALIDMPSEEAAAGKLGELLKKGRLSEQILEFIKYEFDSRCDYALDDLTTDIFNIMLRDGMTYHTDTTVKDDKFRHTDEAYKNIIEPEVNIFVNMLEIVHLWNPVLGEVDDNIAFFLRHNDRVSLDLEGFKFHQGYLSNINLRYADLAHAQLTGSNLTGANFTEAIMYNINLNSCNLYLADFANAQLLHATLRTAHLEYANLVNANLEGADLVVANLKYANLLNADLGKTDLSDADLSWTNLAGADLSGANLNRANLENANLHGAILNGTIFDERQVEMLCDKYDLRQCRVYISEQNWTMGYQKYMDYRKGGRRH